MYWVDPQSGYALGERLEPMGVRGCGLLLGLSWGSNRPSGRDRRHIELLRESLHRKPRGKPQVMNTLV